MSETVTSTPPPPRRWPRLLRHLIGSVLLLGLALLVVLLAGIAWIASQFDPQAQVRQLADLVQARSGYVLRTAAPPRLTFTPRLGLTWGPWLLESPAEDAPAGTAARRVATAEGMHLTLDALALLRGETRVRQVRIDGLSLWPAPDRRYALPAVDLSLSDSPVADAAFPGAAPPPGRAVDPAGANADPHLAPALTHALTLQARVLDATGQALPLHLQGRIGVEPAASPAPGTPPVQRRAFHLLLQGAFDQTTFALDATRTDASPVLRFDLTLGTLDLDHYQTRPLAQPVLTSASGATGAEPGLAAASPAGPVADTASDTANAPVAARPTVRASGTGALLRWVHDLGLDSVDLQGAVRVASLQFMNVKLSHLRVQVQAQDLPLQDSQGRKRRRIDFNPLTASLYEGGVHGTLRLHLDDEAPHPPRSSPATTFFATKLDLRDVRIGPLLRDALGIDWLEGRGNVALDLRSGGAAPGTFTRHLNGSVGLQLRDGSIGLNVADVLRAGLGQLGKLYGTRAPASAPAPVPQADGGSRWHTGFQGLRASFQIEDGVARNQDLNLQAPSLRVGGGGTAWLAENRLDYTLRVTVAPAGLQADSASGATSLDSLRGLTVPVQLRGPFDDVQWRIAYADIAPTPQLRQRLRGWAQDTLDRLRGLLPPGKPKD